MQRRSEIIVVAFLLALMMIFSASSVYATEGGSCIVGTSEASGTWYFAEGYTGEGFQHYLCIGNFQNAVVEVDITFMFSDGTVLEQALDIPAASRATFDVNAAVGTDKEVSTYVEASLPIVVERSMYFAYKGMWSGGHSVLGSKNTNSVWYFAEGYTGAGFDEWICVLNPGDTVANLTFDFQTQEEGHIQRTGLAVPAHSRGSFKVNDVLGPDYQTSLRLSSDQTIVAERPIYFAYQGRGAHGWQGGHCVMGAPSLAGEYFFAEGTTRPGFEEWMTLQNPNANAIEIDATYMLGEGQGNNVEKMYSVPANARITVFVQDEVGVEKDVSIHLQSDAQFLCERPMYFMYQCGLFPATIGGHCIIGTTTVSDAWYFAEGNVAAWPSGPDSPAQGHVQWLCLLNPNDEDVIVEATFYQTQADLGKPKYTIEVPANKRVTVFVNYYSQIVDQISSQIRVVSGPGIVAEMPLYFNY